MRFLHDLGRRHSIAPIWLALAIALVHLIAQQTSAQTTATGSPPATRGAVGQTVPGNAAAGPTARAGAPAARSAAPGTAGAAKAPTGGGPPSGVRTATAGTKPAVAAQPPSAPVAPFQLTADQQKQLDIVLAGWDKRNEKTKSFKCKFRRWEYDKLVKATEANKDQCRSWADGEVKYKRPDHGMFKVDTQHEFNEESQKFDDRADGLEHWVCDGKDIYEFVPDEKKLKVHPLPKEMQGDAIADGPVPFIFGAKADKMKQRYWIRESEMISKEEQAKHIWLEVFPKYQHDAMNFERAIVILDRADFSIHALQIIHPNAQQRTAFMFSKITVNPFDWSGSEFAAPSTPWNWTKVVDPVDEPADTASPPPAADPPAAKQAKRPAAAAGPVQR